MAHKRKKNNASSKEIESDDDSLETNITPRYLRKIFLKRLAYRVCRPIMVFSYKNLASLT